MQLRAPSSRCAGASRPAFRAASTAAPRLAARRAGRGPAAGAAPEAAEQQAAPSTAAPLLAAGGLLTPFLLEVGAAMAKDGEFGLLEGRTAALVHPAMMLFLFGATSYAGYLGWQWRRTRTVGEEIRELKKAMPAVAEGAPAATSPAVEALEKARRRCRRRRRCWAACRGAAARAFARGRAHPAVASALGRAAWLPAALRALLPPRPPLRQPAARTL